jgi:regulator of RNase E activity RraA
MMKPATPVLLICAAFAVHGASFSSSDIADAAERLTGRRAHMGLDMRLLSGSELAGHALTMRIVRGDTALSTEEGLKAIRALETAAPGTVIVADVQGDKSFAVFGATFATLAKSRNLGGFVIDGSMRGLTDFKELAVPMFARGTVSGSAGGHFRLDAINVPIVCGGVEVAPGDFIVGDADGVAVAPKNQYEEVLARATQLREQKIVLLPLITRYRSYTQAVEAQKAKRKR